MLILKAGVIVGSNIQFLQVLINVKYCEHKGYLCKFMSYPSVVSTLDNSTMIVTVKRYSGAPSTHVGNSSVFVDRKL